MANNRTATALSLAALFIALGSGAYAAVTISSNSIGAKQIKPGAVGSSEIAKEAIGAAEMKAEAVSEQKLKDKAVTEQKIQEAAITAAKIAQAAVNEQKLAEAAVTAVKIAQAAVTEQKIQEAAVTAAKIAQAAVTEQKIQDAAVTEAKLAAGAKATLYTDNNQPDVNNLATDTQIASLSLPAGTYLISAGVQAVHDSAANPTRLECYVQQAAPSALIDFAKLRLAPNTDAFNPLVFAKAMLQGPATLPSATTIAFRCTSVDFSTAIDLSHIKLHALRVSNIVAQ